MSLDSDIALSLISVMYLLTYAGKRPFWNKYFCPSSDLNQTSNIKQLGTRLSNLLSSCGLLCITRTLGITLSIDRRFLKTYCRHINQVGKRFIHDSKERRTSSLLSKVYYEIFSYINTYILNIFFLILIFLFRKNFPFRLLKEDLLDRLLSF